MQPTDRGCAAERHTQCWTRHSCCTVLQQPCAQDLQALLVHACCHQQSLRAACVLAYMRVVISSLQGSLQCRERIGGLAMQGLIERPVEAPVDSMAALHVQVCSSNLPFLKILRLPANIATVTDSKYMYELDSICSW